MSDIAHSELKNISYNGLSFPELVAARTFVSLEICKNWYGRYTKDITGLIIIHGMKSASTIEVFDESGTLLTSQISVFGEEVGIVVERQKSFIVEVKCRGYFPEKMTHIMNSKTHVMHVNQKRNDIFV